MRFLRGFWLRDCRSVLSWSHLRKSPSFRGPSRNLPAPQPLPCLLFLTSSSFRRHTWVPRLVTPRPALPSVLSLSLSQEEGWSPALVTAPILLSWIRACVCSLARVRAGVLWPGLSCRLAPGVFLSEESHSLTPRWPALTPWPSRGPRAKPAIRALHLRALPSALPSSLLMGRPQTRGSHLCDPCCLCFPRRPAWFPPRSPTWFR